jgi:hypothetical protein
MVGEPISPELALVCPELRAKAIAALPEQPWFASRPKRSENPLARASAVSGHPARTRGPESGSIAREAAAYLLGRAAGLLAVMAAFVLLVLILAEVAGAVRS